MVSRLEDFVVKCGGGLNLEGDALTLGISNPGAARLLQNYEPSLEGGYERVTGFAEWDSNAIPGQGPVLGVKVALDNVFGARLNAGGTAVDIYKSSGSGWTKINTTGQASTATKYRAISYSISEEVAVFCDGKGPALKYNGTTDTLLNSTDAPATPKYAEVFKNRLALAPGSTSSSVILSAPNDDENFSGISGAIEINVGDNIIGLKRFRDILYIFCHNSIHKLEGNTVDDFAINPVTRSIGCISGDTIEEVGGDLLFLAPDGLRSLAATERIGDVELALQSKKIQPEIRPLVTNSFNEDNFSACVVRRKSQYRLFTYTSGVPDQDAVGYLGRRVFTDQGSLAYEWGKLVGINSYAADSAYQEEEEIIVHAHPTDGKVYRQETGNSFGGVNIDYVYRTPEYVLDNAELRNVLHKATIYTQVKGDVDVLFKALINFEQQDTLQPPGVVLEQVGQVPVYGTAVYGTDVYGAVTFPVFKKNLNGSGHIFSFQFSGSDSNAPHSKSRINRT